jgi:hypothetical protein
VTYSITVEKTPTIEAVLNCMEYNNIGMLRAVQLVHTLTAIFQIIWTDEETI